MFTMLDDSNGDEDEGEEVANARMGRASVLNDELTVDGLQ